MAKGVSSSVESMKVSLAGKSKQPGKPTKGSHFIRAMLQHRSTYFQWLPSMTVALDWLISLPLLLVWPPFAPQTWLGTTWLVMTPYLLFLTFFFFYQHKSSSPIRSKFRNTNGTSVWTTKKTLSNPKSSSAHFLWVFWSTYELFSWPSYYYLFTFI